MSRPLECGRETCSDNQRLELSLVKILRAISELERERDIQRLFLLRLADHFELKVDIDTNQPDIVFEDLRHRIFATISNTNK